MGSRIPSNPGARTQWTPHFGRFAESGGSEKWRGVVAFALLAVIPEGNLLLQLFLLLGMLPVHRHKPGIGPGPKARFIPAWGIAPGYDAAHD
jgi:hypothetical protein